MTICIDPLTIILPCAGEGKRLGLDTPKELLEILPGTRLIDFSLAHARAAVNAGLNVSVVVVSRPWKTEVPAYAAAQLPGVPVETVMFNENYHEWPGSVFSARELFSTYNMVLLPDSFLSFGSGFKNLETINRENKTAAQLMIETLNQFPAAFGHIPCNDPAKLKNLGAMHVDGPAVTRFQDKPRTDFHLYNSFWGCYGFRREFGEPLYHFLLGSVKHTPQSLPEMGTFSFETYRDLGTWESINAYKEAVNSSINRS